MSGACCHASAGKLKGLSIVPDNALGRSTRIYLANEHVEELASRIRFCEGTEHKHGDIVIGECLAIVEQNSQHIISPTDVLDEG